MSLGARGLSGAACESAPAGVRWLPSPGLLRPGGRRSPSGRAGLASQPPIESRCASARAVGLSLRSDGGCRKEPKDDSRAHGRSPARCAASGAAAVSARRRAPRRWTETARGAPRAPGGEATEGDLPWPQKGCSPLAADGMLSPDTSTRCAPPIVVLPWARRQWPLSGATRGYPSGASSAHRTARRGRRSGQAGLAESPPAVAFQASSFAQLGCCGGSRVASSPPRGQPDSSIEMVAAVRTEGSPRTLR